MAANPKPPLTVSDTIRATIRERGLTQLALAASSSVAQPVIQRFLSGVEIRSNNLDKLAAALGLTLRD